jgi:hypothetical protein
VPDDVPILPGQMTVDECIEVAETGSDGLSSSEGSVRTEDGNQEGASLMDKLTPTQRVQIAKRVRKFRSGEVEIPMTCPTCFSKSLHRNEGGVICLTCGRKASMEKVHTIRRQRIKRYLEDGGALGVK